MKNRLSIFKYVSIICFLVIVTSCSDNSEVLSNNSEILNESTTGSGFFEYGFFNNKLMKIYYHIPLNVNSNSKMMFVFHGNGRNARDYRDAMIFKANQYGFIVVTPEFSVDNFPNGDAYNLGNVFIDGDNPSTTTLNPESEWSFSVIEPLFDFIKEELNNSSSTYHVFGHSAGGQFAHRFLMFKPNARYDKVVSSASGWYTVTNDAVIFPYGFSQSPLQTGELSNLFEKNLIIQVGDLDNDPNANSLRHNQFADIQGLNRLDRATYFYDTASDLADVNNLPFQWELHINEGADHNYEVAASNGADLIFNQ